MGSATSTIVATSGMCTQIGSYPPVAPDTCKGTWSAGPPGLCTIQQPTFASTSCTNGLWVWDPKAVPLPCSCTGGAACPSTKLCTGCLKSGICTKDFATAAECATFATAAKWCGA